MKKLGCSVVVMVSLLILCTVNVRASGFGIYEQSARGGGRAGAFAAQADDPSALWYNPAGIAQLEGTQIMVGTMVYHVDGLIKFDDGSSEKFGKEIVPIPHVFITRKLSEKWFVGMGVFAPFGLSSEYNQNWKGRYNGYSSETVSHEFNPNIVYKATDTLSLGIGLSVQRFEVDLHQKIDPAAFGVFGEPDIDQKLTAHDSTSLRYNLSLHWQAMDTLAFGASYRSQVDHVLDGDADYSDVPAALSGVIYDSGVSGEITLPDTAWFGAAFKVTPKLTIETDVVWTGWSSYETLTMNIENGLGTISKDKNWKDVFCYRLGAEYTISDKMSARLGYFYDESPIPDNTIDYTIPAADRHGFTAGFSYNWGKWTMDTTYAMVILADERQITARTGDGILDSVVEKNLVYQAGISLVYAF